MASLFTHPVVPVCLRLMLGRNVVSNRLLLFASVAAVMPDLDVIAFQFGIPYASILGHRGFTHSIGFAVLTGVIGLLMHRYLQVSKLIAGLVLFLSTLSHALLDALTDGGLGVALFWPVSEQRVFLPWALIEVSPIGAAQFFSERGWSVLQSEWLVVWLPLLLLGCVVGMLRRGLQRRQ